MLKLKNVSKYYAKNGVVTQGFTKVNLELHLGEFVVITGESGSGKSTLLNVLSGLDSYEDGEMYINGEETSHYTEEDYLAYRRKYVSNIFQYFNLVNSYTVYENIELAMLMNGKNKKECKKEVERLIGLVGLTKYKHTLVSKLSGGQKQRVAIARALANDSPIIVADEPTGAIDTKSAKEIIELLHKLSENKLIIIVTHNKNDFEKYATRMIKMHDGRILEDKIINKINLDKNLVEKEVESISFLNKIFLGIKNGFNIPVKFTLMFVIFLLISVALCTTYGLFKSLEYESNGFGYTEYFQDASDERIIIKKTDQSYFKEQDYENIRALNNIEKVVKDDLVLDFTVGMNSGDIYLFGTLDNKKITKVDVGRLPKNSNEIVIKGSSLNYYIEYYTDELLERDFVIETYSNKDFVDIKIVGIIYDESENIYTDSLTFYLTDELYQNVIKALSTAYYEVNYKLNDNYLQSYEFAYKGIRVSKLVNDGEVIVSDNSSMYCKNYDCLNNTLNINSKNIYNDTSISLNIVKTYNKENVKNLFNEDYDSVDGYIFVSENDYNKLYSSKNYQSSVFVSDVMYLEDTIKTLNDMGYDTLSLKDAKYDEGTEILQIIKIFKLIVTIGLIITLFFIMYFIIKIIYKSRNSYYTTLRTLGATKGVCTSILRNEMYFLASITYLFFTAFLMFVKYNIFEVSFLKNIIKYMGITEYILIYIILLLLSLLIANRYGRKIFKNSIIKTYGEKL